MTLDPFAGLRAQADALAEGTTTSRALVEAALARIDAAQPQLAAFQLVRHEEALAEADAADARLAAGKRDPLLGVPVAIKDDTDLAGAPTAFGCRGSFTPCERDAEVVRRLRAAGAVVVGKTSTSQLGQWPFGASPDGAYARNPWSPDHTPGGSSAGSAAAVAAGLVAGAVGSDGAGSVRIPAAWTGLVGLKPQRGRVSTFPDREAFKGLTCFGPLTRTVDDAALLLDVIAGQHPEDLHRPPAPDVPFAEMARRDPGRLRIGLSWSVPFSGPPARIHPETRAAVERIAEILAGLGHEIVEASPRYGLVGLAFVPRSLTGVREWVRRVPDEDALDPRTRENARTGALLEGPALKAARAAEPLLRRQLGAVFGTVDVVLTPTTATPPVAFDRFHGLSNWQTDKAMIAACPMAWPWNVVGWPGLSVPAGLTSDGLPVGAMLLGQEHDEGRLLALGRQLEAVERWHERRPPAFADAAPA